MIQKQKDQPDTNDEESPHVHNTNLGEKSKNI